MDSAAPLVFLLARLLLMSDEGTVLLSEHRARVPAGGTGVVVERLAEEGLPGALHIYLTPARPAAVAASGAEGEGPPLIVGVEVRLWESPGGAAAGGPPRETNSESVEIAPGGNALVQIAEDAPRGRRLFLSLSSPPEPERDPGVLPVLPPEPAPIAFRIEAYRATAGARELLESHLLMTVERRPVRWESRWKRPMTREDGSGIWYRDEGVTLNLLPVVTRSGWISVEADLSALLYPEDGKEPISLSAHATRTAPLGIPFEVALELPALEAPPPGGSNGGAAAQRPFIIVEVTPFRPAR